MNGYQPATARAALTFAAVAMAAITLGAMVVLPAKFDALGADPYALAAAKATASAPSAIATGADPASGEGIAEAVPRAVAASAASVVAPGDASGTSIRTGATILGTREFDGKRRRVGLRRRTST